MTQPLRRHKMNNWPRRPATALAPASHEDGTMYETAGGRWCRARRRRAGVLAVTVGLVLLTAACGGSLSSSGSLSSTGTGGASSTFSKELAFSRCVRAHGVPNFPDPNSSGQLPPSVKDISKSPGFPAASDACRYLIPSGGTNAQFAADTREYVRFAGCMRAHRVPNFPDPATDPDGSPVFNLQHADIDTQSPQVKAAALGCMSQLHLAKLPNYRV
jgi:hypothetical protein